ncbi:MAG: hypothetical protein ACFFAE_21610, partial [Candidatus Hodarchaeota archaeon]
MRIEKNLYKNIGIINMIIFSKVNGHFQRLFTYIFVIALFLLVSRQFGSFSAINDMMNYFPSNSNDIITPSQTSFSHYNY